MNATFITQQQFNDIEACVRYLKNTDLYGFTNDIKRTSLPGVEQPVAAIRAGIAFAKDWRTRIEQTRQGIPQINQFIEQIIDFARYLLSKIAALPGPEKRGPLSGLTAIPAFPSFSPTIVPDAGADCLQILRYYQRWFWPFIEVLSKADPGTRDRDAIAATTPRIIDFMSILMNTALLARPAPAGLSRAQRQLATARQHYKLAMAGAANYVAQHQLSTALLGSARFGYSQLESTPTIRRFESELKLVLMTLEQGYRYWNEVNALGSSVQ